MKRFKSILQENFTPSAVLGTGKVNREALRASLTASLFHMRAIFWIAVAMAMAIFGVELYVSLQNLKDLTTLKSLGAAMGLTMGGANIVVRQIAKEMTQMSLLLALVGELDEKALSAVVGSLMKKL